MQKVMLVYEEEVEKAYWGIIEILRRGFRKKEMELTEICIRKKEIENCRKKINAVDADYICSLDMAGFQFDTLLSTAVYNIRTAKQMHLVINEDVLRLYGKYEFALNLFVYVPGDIDCFAEQYPHIPNLRAYRPLAVTEDGKLADSAENEEILKGMIEEVIREAEG